MNYSNVRCHFWQHEGVLLQIGQKHHMSHEQVAETSQRLRRLLYIKSSTYSFVNAFPGLSELYNMYQN